MQESRLKWYGHVSSKSKMGSGRGLVVRVLDSRVVGSIPTPGMVRF